MFNSSNIVMSGLHTDYLTKTCYIEAA